MRKQTRKTPHALPTSGKARTESSRVVSRVSRAGLGRAPSSNSSVWKAEGKPQTFGVAQPGGIHRYGHSATNTVLAHSAVGSKQTPSLGPQPRVCFAGRERPSGKAQHALGKALAGLRQSALGCLSSTSALDSKMDAPSTCPPPGLWDWELQWIAICIAPRGMTFNGPSHPAHKLEGPPLHRGCVDHAKGKDHNFHERNRKQSFKCWTLCELWGLN